MATIIKNLAHDTSDFINSIPVMEQLTKELNCEIAIDPARRETMGFVDKSCKIRLWNDGNYEDLKEPRFYINPIRANMMSVGKGVHITQGYFAAMDMATPKSPLHPKIRSMGLDDRNYDVIFAPYSSKIGNCNKLPFHEWHKIIGAFKNHKVALLGRTDRESKFAMQYPFCDNLWDVPNWMIANLLVNSKYGCISIMNCVSTMCHGLHVRNYVVTASYDKHKLNPDALCFSRNLINTTAGDVLNWLSIKNHNFNI